MATTTFGNAEIDAALARSFMDRWRRKYIAGSSLSASVAGDIFDRCAPLALAAYAEYFRLLEARQDEHG